VAVAFTTYGSLYGTSEEVRGAESAAALAELGVPPEQIHLPGLESGTFDFSLVGRLAACYRRILESTGGLTLERVYVPAWEGGHPDHDATHLLGVRLARARGVAEVFAYPAYRSALGPWPLWRTLSPLAGGAQPRVRALALAEGWRALRLVGRFPSQRRSLLGLLPGMVWQLGLRRRERLVVVEGLDYTRPPHPGRLFYTRRYGLSFEAFSADAAPFLAAWGDDAHAG